MHEFSIAQHIVRSVEATAGKHGVTDVRSVRIRVGALSGVVGYALQSAWEIVRADGVCASSTLDIEEVPLRLECPTCGTVEIDDLACMLCPQCGDAGGKLISGRELELDSIVVGEPEEESLESHAGDKASPAEVV